MEINQSFLKVVLNIEISAFLFCLESIFIPLDRDFRDVYSEFLSVIWVSWMNEKLQKVIECGADYLCSNGHFNSIIREMKLEKTKEQ